MCSLPVSEGKAPFDIPSLDDGTECFTYYKIIGDLKCGTTPLLIMHGGPGAGHEYLLSYGDLWPQYGIPVVLFDHIGCASSTRLPQKAGDKSFWTPHLSIAQLESLIDHLKLHDGPGFHLLAHSYGGMVASNWAGRTQPRGLRRLVLAGTAASKDLSLQGLRVRIDELSPQSQQAIYRSEESEDFDDAYKAAMGEYFSKFICRTTPPPADFVMANKHLAEDKTVFAALSGTSLLKHTGSMIGWDSIPHLHKIKVPTLVYHGEYDTAPEICQIPFFQHIPKVRWVTITGGSHMCHLEDGGLKERVLKMVGDFLAQDTSS